MRGRAVDARFFKVKVGASKRAACKFNWKSHTWLRHVCFFLLRVALQGGKLPFCIWFSICLCLYYLLLHSLPNHFIPIDWEFIQWKLVFELSMMTGASDRWKIYHRQVRCVRRVLINPIADERSWRARKLSTAGTCVLSTLSVVSLLVSVPRGAAEIYAGRDETRCQSNCAYHLLIIRARV